MSCTCTTSPCSCPDACDAANEAIASQLTNFTTAFFGSVTKTCVNNQVVWALPCDLDDGVAGFPRLAGEGIACYLIRYAQSLAVAEFANTVYVDKNWAELAALGLNAYATVQEAYDFANPQASITSPWVMKIGAGTLTDFGGITLTADWNTYVSLFGTGVDISEVSFIDGSSNTGNGFDIDLISANLTLRLIDTSVTGAFTAGNITMRFNTGSLHQSSALAIDTSAGVGGTGGNLILDRNQVGEVRMGTNSPGTIRAKNSRFSPFGADNCIDSLNGGSTIAYCIFNTSNNGTNCIANVTSSGAQITNSLFIPAGTGMPLVASAPVTIVSYNNIARNANHANVTLSEGTFTVMVAAMRVP